MNAENASALVGMTFGEEGDALANCIHTMSPGSSGFGSGGGSYYDMNQAASADTFCIDGGPDQMFDGTAVYNATITYIDGTTASITAVIFQDTMGNTYLSPEFSANADMSALEANAIRSLSVDSLLGSNFSGMTGTRMNSSYVVCFASGTPILTPDGFTPVEELRRGDDVMTRDAGPQPVLWCGGRHLDREHLLRHPVHKPVRIRSGSLGNTGDLMLSPQHMVLVDWHGTERLVRAKHLTDILGGRARICEGIREVTYWHVLLPAHHVLNAQGAACESLYPGPGSLKGLPVFDRLRIAASLPALQSNDAPLEAAYGPRVRPVLGQGEIQANAMLSRRVPVRPVSWQTAPGLTACGQRDRRQNPVLI